MEQVDSTDSPLAVHCLHAHCDRQLRRHGNGQSIPSGWTTAPLLPLFLLLLTGLYMFALPYAAKWRSDAAPAERSEAWPARRPRRRRSRRKPPPSAPRKAGPALRRQSADREGLRRRAGAGLHRGHAGLEKRRRAPARRNHRAHRPRRAQGGQMEFAVLRHRGRGWFLSLHVFAKYIKVTFFRGASLRPVPPGASKQGSALSRHP